MIYFKTSEVATEIEERLALYVQLFNEKNITAVVDLHTDNTQVMAPGMNLISGKEGKLCVYHLFCLSSNNVTLPYY